MRRLMLTLALALAVVAATAAPTAAQSGTLRIGMGVIPSNPDPAFDTHSLALFVYNQMFDTLAVADDKGDLQPALLTSWRVLGDTLTWEFKLRDGVKFHNGEEWDAAALKFNLERYADPKVRSNWRTRTNEIARVDVVDRHTVNVVTKRPWAVLLKDLMVLGMVPPKYYAQVGLDGFSRAPVGTGPFKFKAYDKLSHLTLEAAGATWRGKPGVAEVVFRRLPEAATRVAALEAGEIDVAVDVPVEDVDRLKAKGLGFKAPTIAQPQIVILKSTVDSPLKDVRVRQAINYAVNKEAIVKNLLLGYGRVSRGQLVGPDAYGFHPELKAYPYDPERARKLLAEAGFANGFEINFDGTEGRYPKDKEVEEAIVGQLGNVGVRVNFKIVDSSVYIRNYITGKLGPMFILGQQYHPSFDLNQGLPNYKSMAPHKLLASAEFDALYDAQASEMDPARRLALLHKLGAWFRDAAPVLFLHQFQTVFGVQPRVKGFEPRATSGAELVKVTLDK